MSDDKVDEIEVSQPVNSKKVFSFSWLNIGILCSAFSIIVLILAGGYSCWYLMSANIQLTTLAAQSQKQLQQLQSELNVLKEEEHAAQQTAQQSVDDIKNLKQNITDLSQEKQGNQEKWLLAEARYYVKLANDNLLFSRNISLAVFLLKMADQEISHIVNPKMEEIRKAMAADIANLQAAPQIDIAGLYMKLTALNNQLDQLPLQANQKNVQEQKLTAAAEQKQTGWQRGFYVAWQALQHIVVVRYNPNGSMPLMTPDQQVFLYQNVHSMLAQAVWALLHQQPAVYQTSLQQLTAWIKRYFLLDAPVTRAVLSDLTQLEKIDIYPPALTVMNTLQALNGV